MSLSLTLAQANGGGDPPDEFMIVLFASICGFYLVLLLVGIFFLLTLHKALARCRPRNRTMEPGMVWLNLIPLVQIVWMFITAIRVSESLDNEFYDRRWHRKGDDYGKTLGVITCSLLLGGNMGVCGLPFIVAWFVCWIIYWVKIAGYSGQLVARDYDDRDRYDENDRYTDADERPAPRNRDGDRFDEDDRPARRPRDERNARDEFDDDRGDNDRKPWDRDGR